MLQEVIAAAEQAGRVIQDIRKAGFKVEQKGSQGPVTEADRAADELLRRELLGLERCGWLSEETADDPQRRQQRRLWVVDPLDGTKEFVKGIPEYSVAIGLVEDGRAVLGVVHNPSTGETYSAARGGGAFENGERIRVAESRRLLASRSEIKRGEFAAFDSAWDVVPAGSIEYKLAMIGAGVAGVTFSRGPKWEWDVCAGSVIVEEAGGVATELFGDPLVFNKPHPKVKGILAGAPSAYAEALEAIRVVGASDRMRE
jgi:myo-inositol-1(or 4)-monophosphatase